MRDDPDETPHRSAPRGGDDRVLRVVLADDHASLRSALRSVLSGLPRVAIVGEATTAHEAEHLVRAQLPDVALVDLRLDGASGLRVAERAWADSPSTAVVLLAMSTEMPSCVALPAGIAGLVAKEHAASELPAALDAIARGGRYASPTLAGERAARPIRATPSQRSTAPDER